MSSKAFFEYKNIFSDKLFITIILCTLILLTGCGSKTTSVYSPHKKHVSLSKVSLTSKEKTIFYKTGQLDKNLPAKAYPAIAEQYSHYLNEKRGTMERFSQRSEDYLGHARKVFRSKGMPEELAYLALVESGYNNVVKSHVGAAGMWQFMPRTGRYYGLHQDSYLDERLDPYESVETAATYLKYLYKYFDDWLLAVAAYNAGEGKIGRALKGTGAKDFFTLVERNNRLSHSMKLRQETIDYVPRFLAMSKIMRNLEDLGFDSVDHHKATPHIRLTVRPNTSLKGMASVTKTSWDEFKYVNLAHKRTTTHASRNTYVYVKPKYYSAAKRYAVSPRSRIVARSSKPLYSTTKGTSSYVVKSGDNLSRIASRNGTTVASLLKLNKLSNASKIYVGQVLKLHASNNKSVHVVKYGDTVSGIAHKYNMTLTQLLTLNKKKSTSIQAGERLLVSMI